MTHNREQIYREGQQRQRNMGANADLKRRIAQHGAEVTRLREEIARLETLLRDNGLGHLVSPAKRQQRYGGGT